MFKARCMHCGGLIHWDGYFSEWTHTNGDPQCTNPFTDELMASWGEPASNKEGESNGK